MFYVLQDGLESPLKAAPHAARIQYPGLRSILVLYSYKQIISVICTFLIKIPDVPDPGGVFVRGSGSVHRGE
jgi:hypothetical protein